MCIERKNKAQTKITCVLSISMRGNALTVCTGSLTNMMELTCNFVVQRLYRTRDDEHWRQTWKSQMWKGIGVRSCCGWNGPCCCAGHRDRCVCVHSWLWRFTASQSSASVFSVNIWSSSCAVEVKGGFAASIGHVCMSMGSSRAAGSALLHATPGNLSRTGIYPAALGILDNCLPSAHTDRLSDALR